MPWGLWRTPTVVVYRCRTPASYCVRNLQATRRHCISSSKVGLEQTASDKLSPEVRSVTFDFLTLEDLSFHFPQRARAPRPSMHFELSTKGRLKFSVWKKNVFEYLPTQSKRCPSSAVRSNWSPGCFRVTQSRQQHCWRAMGSTVLQQVEGSENSQQSLWNGAVDDQPELRRIICRKHRQQFVDSCVGRDGHCVDKVQFCRVQLPCRKADALVRRACRPEVPEHTRFGKQRPLVAVPPRKVRN